jgi:hypothetical protein
VSGFCILKFADQKKCPTFAFVSEIQYYLINKQFLKMIME